MLHYAGWGGHRSNSSSRFAQAETENHDGNTLTIKDNQDFYLDAEFDQTATPQYQFSITLQCHQSNNKRNIIKSFGLDTSNADTTVAIAGLAFTDIQTLNVQL